MRVLLINPPETRTVQANLPMSVEKLRGATPPISLMQVAAAARQSGRHEVALLDALAAKLDPAALENSIREFSPDVVGLSVITFTLLDALQTVRIVRRAAPDCIVVAGGLQPTLYPEQTATLGAFDFSLVGEADQSFPKLLDALQDGASTQDVEGLLTLHEGRIVSNPPPSLVADLDQLPFAAHDLLDLPRYRSLVTDRHPVGIMISSRGCPFRCTFCSRSVTGKKFRARSPENVVEEMAWCESLGIRYLLFYDEVMTVSKDRMLALCERIRQKGVEVPWMARARVGIVDRDMLEAMKAAGCDLVTMGIESGSPRVLKRLGRPTDLDAVIKHFRQAREVGLRTIAYFMIGNPDEGPDDLRASLDVAKKARPDMIHASVFMPYPATALYEQALQTGFFERDYWKEFSAAPSEDFRPRIWAAPGRENDTLKNLAWFYRRYYLRPAFVWSRLVRLRGLADLIRGFKGLAAIFSMGRRSNKA